MSAVLGQQSHSLDARNPSHRNHIRHVLEINVIISL